MNCSNRVWCVRANLRILVPPYLVGKTFPPEILTAVFSRSKSRREYTGGEHPYHSYRLVGLSMVVFSARFIPNYSSIAATLHELKKKGVRLLLERAALGCV